MQCAYMLYQDLKKAQEHLILVDYLHLLYIVTPYDIIAQVKPIGSVYYDVVTLYYSIDLNLFFNTTYLIFAKYI